MSTKVGYFARIASKATSTSTPLLGGKWEATGQVDTVPSTTFESAGWQEVDRAVRKWDLTFTLVAKTEQDITAATVNLVEGNRVPLELYEAQDETPHTGTFLIQSIKRNADVGGNVTYDGTATSTGAVTMGGVVGP